MQTDVTANAQLAVVGVSKTIATTSGNGTSMRLLNESLKSTLGVTDATARGKLGLGVSVGLEFKAEGSSATLANAVNSVMSAATAVSSAIGRGLEQTMGIDKIFGKSR